MKLTFSFLLFFLVCSGVSSVKLETKSSDITNVLSVDGDSSVNSGSEELMADLVERMTFVFRENSIKPDAFDETRSAKNCYWIIEEGLIRHLLGDDVSVCFMQAVYDERTPFTLKFNMKYCSKEDRLSGNTMIKLLCGSFPLLGNYFDLAQAAVKANQVYQDDSDVYQRVMGRFRPALDKQLHEIYIELRPPEDATNPIDAAPLETFPIFNLELAVKKIVLGSRVPISREARMIMSATLEHLRKDFQLSFLVEIPKGKDVVMKREAVLHCTKCCTDSALEHLARAAYKYMYRNPVELRFAIRVEGYHDFAIKNAAPSEIEPTEPIGDRLELEFKKWIHKSKHTISFAPMSKLLEKQNQYVVVGAVFPLSRSSIPSSLKSKAAKKTQVYGVLVLSAAPTLSEPKGKKKKKFVQTQIARNPTLATSLTLAIAYFNSEVPLPDLLAQNGFIDIFGTQPTIEEKGKYLVKIDKKTVLKIDVPTSSSL